MAAPRELLAGLLGGAKAAGAFSARLEAPVAGLGLEVAGVGPVNPTRTITDLLRPLADLRMPDERPAVRLLLGTRSSRLGTSAEADAPTARAQAPNL